MKHNLVLKKDCSFCEYGIATLCRKMTTFHIKGKEIKVKAWFYKCQSCKKEFTTTESDTLTLDLIYKQIKEENK